MLCTGACVAHALWRRPHEILHYVVDRMVGIAVGAQLVPAGHMVLALAPTKPMGPFCCRAIRSTVQRRLNMCPQY